MRGGGRTVTKSTYLSYQGLLVNRGKSVKMLRAREICQGGTRLGNIHHPPSCIHCSSGSSNTSVDCLTLLVTLESYGSQYCGTRNSAPLCETLPGNPLRTSGQLPDTSILKLSPPCLFCYVIHKLHIRHDSPHHFATAELSPKTARKKRPYLFLHTDQGNKASRNPRAHFASATFLLHCDGHHVDC